LVPADSVTSHGAPAAAIVRVRRAEHSGHALLRWARHEPFAVAGAAIYAVIVIMAVFADRLAPYDPRAMLKVGSRVARYLPMSSAHWLGTTSSGRDVLSQVIFGARAALEVGLTAAFAVVAIGTLLGLVAGYWGGWVNRVITWFADVVLGLPFLPTMLVLAALTHPGTGVVIFSVAALLWPNTARVIRAQVMSLRARTVSWGVMLQEAYADQALSRGAWNWFAPPGVAIMAMVLAGFLISRGSEKLLFPKLAEQ
jgi:peptide/nickel transport system permease protein